MFSTAGLCCALECTSRGSVQFKTISMRTGNPICALLQATVGGWSRHLEGVFSGTYAHGKAHMRSTSDLS